MKKKLNISKTKLVLGIVMSSLIMVTLGVSSFAYWQKDSVEVTIPTYEFNATEEEFTYYACIPNVASTTGYDYYDLESIPSDLVDRVTALAAVRFEALTKTAYIPSYPKVTIGGNRFNYTSNELPVIHVLNSLSSDEAVINNGFSHIETLIIPETITYIQPGSFVNSTNLKEVTILGELNPDLIKDPKAKKAGYLSVSNNEFGSAKIYKKDANRLVAPTIQLDTDLLRFAQFGGSFEYDNLTGLYYTYVITGGEEIAAGALADGSPSLRAKTKYKLIHNGSSFKEIPYTYTINFGDEREELVLNNNVNYEEYILDSNKHSMSVIRLNSYPSLEVLEYANNELNSSAKAVFELSKLNASYSSDNTVFDIKFAPSHVYESIHYRSDGDELVEDKTMTQISAEKAYFLNQVTSSSETKTGENFVEISVSDNSYLNLYVKATHDDYDADVYYIDPTDPEGLNTYIQMEKVGSKYRYEFRGSNCPKDNVVPNQFLFYNGQYNVVSYPEYVPSFTSEQEIQESLTTENHNTRRIYLQLYKDDGYGNNIQANADMITADKNPTAEHEYQWYIVYWYNENGKEVQHYFRVYYADNNSTVIIADIPEIAEKFKFVRVDDKETPIKDALKNNWVNMVNFCAQDLKFNADASLNLYEFNEWWKDSYANQFSVINENAMPDKTEFKLRNKNYLILSNYGQLGANGIKYLPIDESLGYPSKDVTTDDSNTTFKLEFTRFDNYLDRNIQTISLPKGTLIEARVINISSSSSTPTYFTNTIGYPSSDTNLTANDKDDVAIQNPSDFFVDDGNGKIKVLKDCSVEVYLKMEYAEQSQDTPVGYQWHFNIKSTGLRGFSRTVVVNPSDIIDVEPVTSSRTVNSQTYPVLNSTGNIIKLDRNHANRDFEEYRVLSDTNLSGEYIVTPYYESNKKFGGNSGNTYYGTINPNSPSGELDLTSENIVMFSPNGTHAYENKYYAAYDDYGNFLTFLSFNRTQTIKEGYQVLSAVVPQAIYDFQNIKIYEVNSDGEILENAPVLNQITNLNTLLENYNKSTYANTEDYLKYDQSNSLMFDYFIRQMGEFTGDNFYTNNIGVTYGVKENPNDLNSDVLYYFNNVKIALADTRDSTNLYQITTKDNKTTAQQIFNNLEPLDEQIIDGYYYNGISITGDDLNIIRFMKEGSNLEGSEQYFKEGYYDFVLRKRGTKLYLGYKYLGDEALKHTNYYLYIYQNDELIDTVKMDHMNNDNHYFADICYEGTIKVEVYNEQKVRLYYDDTKTYTSTTDYISRFYYGVTSFVTKVEDVEYRLYESKMGKIALDFNMGSHPKDDTNIRYNETDYLSDLDYYEVKVRADSATEIYYAKDSSGNIVSSLKKHGKSYIEYIVNTEFNKVLSIYLNDQAIEGKTVTLPQPGKYEVSYNATTRIVSCIKVQNPDVFYLYINEEMVAELEVNPETNKYYEYQVEEHIVLETKLDFTANDIRVLDGQGNLAAVIEKVTLTENTTTSSVTSIPVGAYALTYSVDSSRREGDKYQVFTYLNFTPLETVTVTYKYHLTGAENEKYTSTSKMVIKDATWKFEIFDLETLDTFYTPAGTYFDGWSTSSSATEPTYVVGQKYGTDVDLELYPVFKDCSLRHQTIWVKAPDFDSSGFAVFSLTNLDTTYITGVSYSGYDDYINGTNGKPKYVTINPEGKRIVTVDQSLFETIGYVTGGVKLVVHLKSEIDGKTSTCTVNVDYPNYDNRQP